MLLKNLTPFIVKTFLTFAIFIDGDKAKINRELMVVVIFTGTVKIIVNDGH